MSGRFIFDMPHYDALNTTRLAVIEDLLNSLRTELSFETAADVGCGVGHLSSYLASRGLKVLALDGREENVSEAKRRFPAIDFQTGNAEDEQIRLFGTFDLVVCAGLLYHLENPFAAVRNIFALTGKVAIIEGMCVPGKDPNWALRDEGPTEDQGLRHVAFYPTENGLIKLLYRAGFPFVYRFRRLPAHPNYRTTATHRQSRTILAASRVPVSTPLLARAAEPKETRDLWLIAYSPATVFSRTRTTLGRARRFATKPWQEKLAWLRSRLRPKSEAFNR